jgi:hypothetical protein
MLISLSLAARRTMPCFFPRLPALRASVYPEPCPRVLRARGRSAGAQVRQWEARVQELEEECGALKERAKTAETAASACVRAALPPSPPRRGFISRSVVYI